MNPKIPEPMNWKDYSTTAIQWLSIIGGIALVATGGAGIPNGVALGAGLAMSGLSGGKKGSLIQDILATMKRGKK